MTELLYYLLTNSRTFGTHSADREESRLRNYHFLSLTTGISFCNLPWLHSFSRFKFFFISCASLIVNNLQAVIMRAVIKNSSSKTRKLREFFCGNLSDHELIWGVLHIKIIECQGLRNKDKNTFRSIACVPDLSDPYVTAWLGMMCV